MNTLKVRMAVFVAVVGLLMVGFAGMGQKNIKAAEPSGSALEREMGIGNDSQSENEPTTDEEPQEPSTEEPEKPRVVRLPDLEIIKGKKKQIVISKVAASDLVWKSSKPKTASISKNGYVKGISTGKTVITAEYGNVTYKCVVKVFASKKHIDEWVLKKGRYYYYNSYGEKVTGKTTIHKKEYYFDKEGRQHTGWMKQAGKYYYYQVAKKNKGYMLKNQKVNGIRLSKDGSAKLTSTNKKKLQLYVDAGEIVFEETDWTMTRKQALKKMFLMLAKDEIITYRLIGHFRNSKQWDVYYANQYFSTGYGDCYTYASAMAYFGIALGYENVWVCSSGHHGWCQIDGLYYDPRYANWGTSDMMKAFAVPEELCGKGGRMNWKRWSTYRCRVDG